ENAHSKGPELFVLVLAPSPNASPILVDSGPAVPVVRNAAQTSNVARVESNHFAPRFALVRALFLRLSSPARASRTAMLRNAVFKGFSDMSHPPIREATEADLDAMLALWHELEQIQGAYRLFPMVPDAEQRIADLFREAIADPDSA